MKDFFPKGTGNSRYLKSSIPAGTTHEELVAMLREGTFPIDLNGINAAGVAQQGTALNKANLLKDATAALFGLGSDAVPDDVLNQLGGLANYYIWRKSTLSEPASYTLGPEHELTMFDNRNLSGGDTKSFQYSSNVSVSSDGFTISLNSPSSVQIKQNYGGTIAKASVLYGKFVSVNNSIYFFPADCVVTGNYVSSSSTPVIASKAQLVSGVAAQYETSYVFSTERNKYPDSGESGGSEYTYFGQLGSFGNRAQIITGSYVGTNAKVSITLPFAPKYFSVMNAEEKSNYTSGYWILGAQCFNKAETSAGGYNAAVSVQDNVISYDGFNGGMKTFVYIAFG